MKTIELTDGQFAELSRQLASMTEKQLRARTERILAQQSRPSLIVHSADVLNAIGRYFTEVAGVGVAYTTIYGEVRQYQIFFDCSYERANDIIAELK